MPGGVAGAQSIMIAPYADYKLRYCAHLVHQCPGENEGMLRLGK